MKDDSCLTCGATFARKRSDQRFCSSACRYRHKDFGTPEGREAALNRKRRFKAKALKSCPGCGVPCGGVACRSTLCQAIARRLPLSCDWPRNPISTPITPAICGCCELTFIKRPGMNHGEYCSSRCRSIARGHQAMQSHLSYGSCLRCAATFVRREGCVGRYCSKPCLKAAEKRRREALKRSTHQTGERFTIRQVGERDGWRCHLCGKRVPDQRWSGHPLDATVDHLLPLSAGGTDTLANVKLAHFQCNTRRGVGGVVQLALV
jgi:HNH endonuclease